MAKAKVLTKEEIRRVFRIIETSRYPTRDAATFALSIHAGMRCKEICSLRIGDIRGVDGQTVDIINLSKSQTKGGKNSRRVFISDDLKKILNVHLKTVQKLDDAQAFIRSTQTNRHFSTVTLSTRMKRIYRSAGIVATSHSGRRSFATSMGSLGIGMRTIMQCMGHRSISSTALYIDVSDEQMVKAVNAI